MILQGAKDYKLYDEGAAERFKELSLGGMKAVFIYSPNVYTDGHTERYDAADRGVRTVSVSGEVYAPCALFSDFLGASVCIDGGTATVTRGDASARFEVYDSKGVFCLPVRTRPYQPSPPPRRVRGRPVFFTAIT